MKKRIFTSLLICLTASSINAQIPNVGRVKIPKGKEKGSGQPSAETTTISSERKENTDTEGQAEKAYFFNDKNAELSELKNQYPERMNYLRSGYFSRMLIKFDAQNTLAEINDAEKKWPETYNQDFWVISQFRPAILDYNSELVQLAEKITDQYVNESSKELNSGNKVKALEIALYADSLAKAVEYSAGKDQAVKIIANVSAQVEKAKNAIAANYFSAYHKANAGTIKFSDAVISAGSENDSRMKTSFIDGEKIFGMIYLHGQLKDYYLADRGENHVFLNVSVNNDGGNRFSIPVTNEDLNKAYLSLSLVCLPGESDHSQTGKIMKSFADRFKTGKNTVVIEFLSKDQYLGMAQGSIVRSEFTIEGVTGFPELLKMQEEFVKIEVENARIPAPLHSNASLESDMKRISKQLFEEEVIPLRASLQEQWNIEYQDNGAPYLRYMHGIVAFKVSRTGKCYYRMMIIGQNYEGAGKYGASYLYDGARPFDLVEINCENVNK